MMGHKLIRMTQVTPMIVVVLMNLIVTMIVSVTSFGPSQGVGCGYFCINYPDYLNWCRIQWGHSARTAPIITLSFILGTPQHGEQSSRPWECGKRQTKKKTLVYQQGLYGAEFRTLGPMATGGGKRPTFRTAQASCAHGARCAPSVPNAQLHNKCMSPTGMGQVHEAHHPSHPPTHPSVCSHCNLAQAKRGVESTPTTGVEIRSGKTRCPARSRLLLPLGSKPSKMVTLMCGVRVRCQKRPIFLRVQKFKDFIHMLIAMKARHCALKWVLEDVAMHRGLVCAPPHLCFEIPQEPPQPTAQPSTTLHVVPPFGSLLFTSTSRS